MIETTSCRTYHKKEGKPLYPTRFINVLDFEPCGLAAVLDNSGAYHINDKGKPLYTKRFERSFGFYCGRAAVLQDGKAFHIKTDGSPLYNERYAFCGNFQENRCVIKDFDEQFFHIDLNGKPIYRKRWTYAGDFREGRAAVTNDQGLQTHIDTEGKLVHNQWYPCVDVYHKGFARVRTLNGWTHIDEQGIPIYPERYTTLEPFYNGVAVAETFDGGRLLINEQGKVVGWLNKGNSASSLSADMVGFWKSYTLYAASTSKLLTYLPSTTGEISEKTGFSTDGTYRLLRALWELDIVTLKRELWMLTAKGKLLATVPFSSAAQIWTETHVPHWQNILQSLKNPPSHDYFMDLSHDQTTVQAYQNALSGYAEIDYTSIPHLSIWSQHQTVMDLGGGTGTLLFSVLDQQPHLQGILVDRPEVIAQATTHPRCIHIGQSFFEPLPQKADAIILSRVLHDWNDEQALNILHTVHDALTENGSLYIIEMEKPSGGPEGGLLDLNMLLATGGRERSRGEWSKLLNASGFQLLKTDAVSPILSFLQAEKGTNMGHYPSQ